MKNNKRKNKDKNKMFLITSKYKLYNNLMLCNFKNIVYFNLKMTIKYKASKKMKLKLMNKIQIILRKLRVKNLNFYN